MNIADLMSYIANLPDCVIHPVSERKSVSLPSLSLPDDMKYFYELCNGVILYLNTEWEFRVAGLDKLLRMDIVAFEPITEERLSLLTLKSISRDWYCIGRGDFTPHFSVDLSPNRRGWCFNTDWSLYPSESYRVTKSFTELLHNLVNSKGTESDFWDEIPEEERVYFGDL